MASLLLLYGPAAVGPPPGGFFSKGEEAVYWELYRRLGPTGFRYHVPFGDIAFTPQRDRREADFVLDALDLIILVNSPFTHPSEADDLAARALFGSVGYRVYFVWDYEVLAELGGDVRKALDKIPGLAFFGQNAGEAKDAGWVRGRTYGQPGIDVSFRPNTRFALKGF